MFAIASLRCAGQATITSAPQNNYLLKVSQEWGRTSALGDLVAAPFGPDDLELRFWSGYGVVGTRGLILRRTNGRWEAWRAVIVECHLYVPMSIADTLSAPAKRIYEDRARANCTQRPELRGPSRDIQADSVGVIRIDSLEAPAFWSALVRGGIDSLPVSVPRATMMMDGHGYVVELRRGNSYTASEIRQQDLPSVRADSIVQRLARLIEPHSWGQR